MENYRKIEKIKALIKTLNEASEAYYNYGNSVMSDTEFDKKIDELKKLESETKFYSSNSPTQNVGATILKNIPEVKHDIPMLSLDKCHSVEEVVEFSKGKNSVASIKLDGMSVRLIYKDGDLLKAVSRGNGIVGNDITEAVKQFTNVPLHINKEGIYKINGEALIKLDDFKEVNKNGEYKNSRNLTAGTLSTLDTSVVKNRKISWYAWEVVEGAKDSLFSLQLSEAESLGFDVVPFRSVVYGMTKIDEVIEFFIKKAEEMNLPQDGVVFKFQDTSYGKSLGYTSHHFRNGIAWKAKNDDVETKLKGIEWTMGKTGSLCPTAIFEPVELEGTTVERASLHNISVMRETLHQPFEGQVIATYKSNLIIPQIRWGEYLSAEELKDKTLINPPDKCPLCGGETEIIKENNSEILICKNPDCQGKLLGKLSHAVSKNALDIDGLSDATLQRFINKGWICCIKDIYHLCAHKTDMLRMDGFGEKSVENLLGSIGRSRIISLDRFLAALSIPLIGTSASKDIAKMCNYDIEKFKQIMGESPYKFTAIDGFGDKMAHSLFVWWTNNCGRFLELEKEFFFEEVKENPAENKLEGKNFVITGKLHHFANRSKLKEKIEQLGGKVVGSISSKTDYLINNDKNSTSSKNIKAKQLNIPIISENDFEQMVEVKE